MFQKEPFCFTMKQSPLNTIPEISILGWMAHLWFLNVISFFWVPLVFVIPVATYLFQSTASSHSQICSQASWNKSIRAKHCIFQNVLLYWMLKDISSKPNKYLPKKTIFCFCILLKIWHSQFNKRLCKSFSLAMIHAPPLNH